MKETWDFDCCKSIMSGEIELLKKISAAQNSVRQAVLNREWTDFDERVQEVSGLGEEFALLESERAVLFSALPDASAGNFYAFIMELPTEQRRELSHIYRELKMEAQKMRALNETFLAYVNEAKMLAASYLEAVCPARGGKLYTRKGRRVSQDLRSIMFNNHF